MSEAAPTLEGALAGLDLPALEARARHVAHPLPEGRAALAALLLARLGEHGLPRAWRRLEPLQKLAVADAAHGDGALDLDGLRSRYGAAPEPGEELDLFFYGGRMPMDLQSALQRIAPAPLGASGRSAASPAAAPSPGAPPADERGEPPTDDDVWAPPAEVATPPEAQERLGAPGRLPIALLDRELAAPDELQAVLEAASADRLPLHRRTGAPLVAARQALAPKLQPHPGVALAHSWVGLVQLGGLAAPRTPGGAGGKRQPTLALTPAGRAALTDPLEGLRACWRGWLGSDRRDGLERLALDGLGRCEPTPASGRRAALARALAGCPVGAWVSAEALLRRALIAGETLQVSRAPWRIKLGGAALGGGTWAWLEVRWALTALVEGFGALGLVDLAIAPPTGARYDYGEHPGAARVPWLSTADGLQGVRLTPLGAWLLEIGPRPGDRSSVAAPALHALPNRELAMLGAPLTPKERGILSACTSPVSERVLRLEATKILAAATAGQPVAALRAVLEARSFNPLPPNVAGWLEELEARAGRVRDAGPARLLTCADAATAAEIHTRLGDLCIRAGETGLVVRSRDLERLRRSLIALGYALPRGGGAP